MAAVTSKTKRCVIRTNVAEETLEFCEPVLTVVNGKNAWSAGDIIRTVRVRDYPTEIRNLAALTVGFRNKFMDTYSDPATPIADALGQMHEQLLAGNWAVKGEGSERTTLFLEAYSNILVKTDPTKDLAWTRRRVNEIESGDDEGRKLGIAGARAHPEVVAEMARLQIERARERQRSAKDAAKTAGILEGLD